MNRLYFGVLYSLLYFMGTVCHGHVPVGVLQMQAQILPVDKEIADKCSEYVQSKGFEGFKFVTLSQSFWLDSAYAFTLPYGFPKLVFLSGNMLDSMKNGLQNERSLPVYDKFVLLHELGHHHPYGLGVELADPLLPTGALLCYMSGLWFVKQLEEEPGAFKNIVHSVSVGMFYVSLAMMAKGLYNRRIIFLQERKFKKHTFKHADLEFEKHVKDACEEQDADSFAYRFLSATELDDLHAHLSTCSANADENAYHPAPEERCVAIKAELAKRENA